MAAGVAGQQVSAFIAKPYTNPRPAVGSLPQLAQGTHSMHVSIPVTVTRRDGDAPAGLGRQQESEGQICLHFDGVNRGASPGKKVGPERHEP